MKTAKEAYQITEGLTVSFKLMAMALDVKTGSPITKLILLKICDNANDAGECWPSQDTIASQCETSRETVNRHIKKLCDVGILIKKDQTKHGMKTVSKYQVSLDVTESHNRCDGESHPDVTESHNIEPIIEPIIKENIKEKFKLEVRESWQKLGGPEYLIAPHVHEFFDYWTEINKTGKLMRFEKQTFFDISKRLATWKRNGINRGTIKDVKSKKGPYL